MLKNNNQEAVTRIARRSMESNKTRNVFAMLAVVLTTFMISTVFSIGVSFASNYTTMLVRMQGTTSSIYLNNPTPEQYQKIKELSYIQSAGIQVNIGAAAQKNAENKDLQITLLYFDQDEWKRHFTPAISDIQGQYPQKSDEIMMSLAALKQMGIEAPSVGMQIPLTYAAKDGEKTRTFTLAGWFTDYDMGSARAFLSESYCRDNGLTAQTDGRASVTCKTGMQGGTLEKIEKDVPPAVSQKWDSSYDRSEQSSEGAMVAAVFVVMISLFIVFSGYLLIYNVMYISVTKDIQFYGMLKTIGTSPRQIKRIVHHQAFYFSGVGIPAGLLLGILASFVAVPFAMEMFGDGMSGAGMPGDVSFHPLIFIATALFSLLTVYISCRKPAKIASSVSPVEALRFTGGTGRKNKKARKSTHGGKLSRMALYNVFRDRKRAALVFASLFMGTITFLSVNSFISSMGVENFIGRYYPEDFHISSNPPLVQKFDKDFMKALEEIDGIQHMETVYQEPVKARFDETLFEPFLRTAYERYMTNQGAYDDMVDVFRNGDQDYAFGAFVIDKSYVEKYNKTAQTPIDVDAFERGETAIMAYTQYADGIESMLGKQLELTSERTGKTASVRVGGAFSYSDCSVARGSVTIGAPGGVFVSRAFVQKLTEEPVICDITIRAQKDKEPQVKAALKGLCGTLTDRTFELESKSDMRENFKSSMMSMNILGSGISILLILIGVLNFINVMMTGVYTRRQELAVMESIGMTKKQISRMLTLEGGYYAALTTALILTLGSGILSLVGSMTQTIADYAVYHFPFLPMAALVGVIFLVCLTVPSLVYRSISRESVTERLRRAED